MVAAPVTEAEVQQLLAEPMRIDQSVRWEKKSDDAWVEARLRVRHPRTDIELTLVVTVNVFAERKFSVSVLLDGQRIIALDVNGSHDNKHTDSRQFRHQTHEHIWTDACHGSWAYPVTDSPDYKGTVLDFCARHRIAFNGRWQNPPAGQPELGDT